jgi:D-alanyl-D-alanine carboxypeptidase (penicillin-binding protein 5/6)
MSAWLALTILPLPAVSQAAGPLQAPATASQKKDRQAERDRSSPPLPLKSGDSGTWVESLQRRLNARLDPSPGLDVDGDFGASTRAAVVRFQTLKGLLTTGVVDARTWDALGSDPGRGPEPPAPEVVNARRHEKQPPDPLDGPPFVTANAWVVLDGKTGAVVEGHDEDKPLDMASTTKMMTALVVLRAARARPALFDETVTFSEKADRTPGSTSGVRAGESLPLRELLYGLLLPSGNDASVALAEHVGARLDPTPADGAKGDAPATTQTDPYERFVAEMNRVAADLGLKSTHFVNTHGLTAAGHHSSARDLARLAREALSDPNFARVVSTPERGCALKLPGADKGTRNVVWTNTNRLLATEGYDGVKTGTTAAAGQCLVASGRRGDDHLIVVILGSTSTEGRYADARNLFRWAWLRRGHRD